jgi:hypothetical protein
MFHIKVLEKIKIFYIQKLFFQKPCLFVEKYGGVGDTADNMAHADK